MTLLNYLKNKLPLLLLNFSCAFLLSLYLTAVGNQYTMVLLLVVAWSFILSLWLGTDYIKRKHFFSSIDSLMQELDQPYLIQEFLPQTWNLEDELYQQILKKSNKAVIERIHRIEEEQKEYREFIEGWIHEVKLPLTGISLVSHSLDSDSRHRLVGYITTLENDVEQALFYARSDQVYKDYMIREMQLKPIIIEIIKKNKFLLIQGQISVEVLCEEDTVYSDSKWVAFIINQILINSMKYKNSSDSKIIFQTHKLKERVILSIRDNGIGISSTEIDKVFDKGFTGTNGRNLEKSTGIGLYLCQKLCRKLGLEIALSSVEHEYTEVVLTFPVSSYLTIL